MFSGSVPLRDENVKPGLLMDSAGSRVYLPLYSPDGTLKDALEKSKGRELCPVCEECLDKHNDSPEENVHGKSLADVWSVSECNAQ